DQRDVDIADPVARVSRERHGMSDELCRGCALPLGVAGREMLTDVALCTGAEDRVHHGMKRNVRIAMSGKALAMLNANSAQPELFAFGKAVDIIAGSDADHGGARVEVRREGQLAQPLVAFDQRDRVAGGAGDL